MIPEDKYKTKAQTTRTPTKQRARTDFMVITFICTHTQNFFNQNTVFIARRVLIGNFTTMSSITILTSFMTLYVEYTEYLCVTRI